MNPLDDELDRRIGTRIKRAEQLLMATKARALKPFDITVPQYATLLYLRYVPAASAAQLARASLVSPQTMATILGNLEGKGLVERTASLFHQKVLETRLTEAGRQVVDEADLAARAIEDRMLDAVTADEAAQLKSLLDRVMAAIDEAPDVRDASA